MNKIVFHILIGEPFLARYYQKNNETLKKKRLVKIIKIFRKKKKNKKGQYGQKQNGKTLHNKILVLKLLG